jgi:Beta-lactamase
MGARPSRALAPILPDELARIEQESGGRLGVAVRDSATGAQAGHRADERFPLCNTFKLLAAAALLSRVDAGDEIARAKKCHHCRRRPPHCGGTVMSIRLLDARLCDARGTIVPLESNNLVWERGAGAYVGLA